MIIPGIIFDDSLFFIGFILDKKRLPLFILTIMGLAWNHRLTHFSLLCMLAVGQHREIKKRGKIILSILLLYFLIFSSAKHTAISSFLYTFGNCEHANLSNQYMEWVNCIWADIPNYGILGYGNTGLFISSSENETHQQIIGPFWKLEAVKNTLNLTITYNLNGLNSSCNSHLHCEI